MMRRKAAMTATAAGLVLTGSLVAGAAPSYAAGTTGAAPAAATAGKAPKTDGAKALCRRVPRLERRIDRAITRLDAGAGTRGSIVRLQDRVDIANREGHTAVAKLLGDRLTYRKSLLPNLQQRQSDLKSVASWCASGAAGTGATSNSSSAS